MHWRETPLRPTPGRERVAFLGDSFTFGSWASDFSRAFVGVFESRLPGNKFEALNFGVGGYGLLDEELLLKELALSFEPSYVIVVTYTGNDFRDTWLGLSREDIVDGTARLRGETLRQRVPSEQLIEDNRIALDCPLPAWRRLASSSAAFRRLAPLFDLENLCVIFQPNQNFLIPGFWSRKNLPEVGRQARGEVLDALSRMDLLTGAHRARLAVVALPTSDQVYALEPSGSAFDTALPQEAIQTFCRERQIPYLDLLPLLRQQAAASNRRLYLRNDIHLNDFGHARVGEGIAAWFLARVQRGHPYRP
jgi:lysophospholipase L1-like esterase